MFCLRKIKYIVSWIYWAVFSTWVYSGLKHSYLMATYSSHPVSPFRKGCVSFGLVFIREKICSETCPERSPSGKACSGGGPAVPDHHRMPESCWEPAVMKKTNTEENLWEKTVLGLSYTVLIRSPLSLCNKNLTLLSKKKLSNLEVL